jgi:hypothetical protein
LIKKLGYISEKEGKTISRFLMHTTFPALMLVSPHQVGIRLIFNSGYGFCISRHHDFDSLVCFYLEKSIAFSAFTRYVNWLDHQRFV